MAEDSAQELEVAAGDKKIKLRGSDLLTSVIGMVMCTGLGLFGYVLWDHKTDAKEVGGALASAINQMTQAQREMIQAQREQNCLISLPPDRREQQAAFCRNVTR